MGVIATDNPFAARNLAFSASSLIVVRRLIGDGKRTFEASFPAQRSFFLI